MRDKKFVVIILALFFGFLAGVAGELIVRFYFLKDLYNFSYSNEINLSDGGFNKANVVIRDAKKVIVNQDVKVRETINSANESFVGIFKKINQVSTASTSLSNYYDLNAPQAVGLSLTNDGWVMLNTLLVEKDLLTNYIAVTKDKKVYQIDEFLNDEVSGVTFIHLANANDLFVKNLAGFRDFLPGQLVVAIDWRNSALLTAVVSSAREKQALKSSDKIEEEIVLADKLPESLTKVVIFSLGGDIIGLVDDQGQVRPLTNFRARIMNLLKNRQPASPVLGVNYLDLTQTLPGDINKWGESLGQKGALIYANTNKIAVVKNSPAAKAGLLAGDLIISIDGVEINETNDLGEIIQNSEIGEKVIIKYLRNNQAQQVEVVLEAAK